jgi:tetratricopeptide (TPR) repeat protein
VAVEHRANALRMLSFAQTTLGDTAAGVPVMRRALALMESTGKHPFNLYLSIAVEHTDDLTRLGDAAAAESGLRAILAESQQKNGLDHVDTLHVETRLAALLHVTGRRDEARGIREALLARIAAGGGGANAAMTRVVGRNSAISYLQEGQFDAAASASEMNLEQTRRAIPDSILAAAASLRHGQVLTATGAYDEAAPLLDRAIDLLAQHMGADLLPQARMLFDSTRAQLLLVRGDAAQAAAQLQRQLEAARLGGAVVWLDQVRALNLLAAAQLALRQPDAARRSAETALAELQRANTPAGYPALKAEALLQLGRASLVAGAPQAAAEHISASLELRRGQDVEHRQKSRWPNAAWRSATRRRRRTCCAAPPPGWPRTAQSANTCFGH